ncbi:MAG: SLATT domain-containing protein [Nitrospirota bacterium]|nr:SLATT domain-containing protein [Nitrospirota bacterium]MDH5586365.1 SLATT domain-containing protein [Nitrospirota bacterium]MDH5775192.1 SLATT domain-containing protein [Nitrospirota bacterium]
MGPRSQSVVEAMDGQPSPQSQVEAFLAAVHAQPFFGDENQQGSIRWYIAYYKERAPKRRLAFRISGFLLLVLSVSLPFLTWVAGPEYQASVASTLSWLIALVAAASSFFNWQRAWQGYTQTQLTLQFLLTEWELKTAEARAAGTDAEGVAILRDALNKIMAGVTEAVSQETAQYFEGVHVPQVQTVPGGKKGA